MICAVALVSNIPGDVLLNIDVDVVVSTFGCAINSVGLMSNASLIAVV